jgi:hypothetical protein
LGVLLIVKKGPAFRRALEGNDAKPIMNKF